MTNVLIANSFILAYHIHGNNHLPADSTTVTDGNQRWQWNSKSTYLVKFPLLKALEDPVQPIDMSLVQSKTHAAPTH